MTPIRELDFVRLLRSLDEGGVDFLVVGGVCGVLHGAPLTTFDLDIVPAGDPANLDRLFSCLTKIHAIYRGRGEEALAPERSHLSHRGHMLLLTDYGPLDLLGYIGKNWTFENLAEHTNRIDCEGMALRILDLETLIRIKEETARAKDRTAILLLRAVLEERKKAP